MREWRSSRRVPPVLLITGLKGVGKRSLSYFLAQWLLCDRSGMNSRGEIREENSPSLFASLAPALDGEPSTEAPAAQDPNAPAVPCGECASCHKALRGSWIDFEEIRSGADDENEKTLKVEQFRRLKAQQGYSAHESDYRVILIPDADRMTMQAANSVLKLLEEPPRGWIFLLTASDSNLLLPTLVSRCQTLRLKPFPDEPLERLIAASAPGGDPKRRRLAVMLAQGSWGKAMQWTEDDAWKNRGLILDFLKEPQAPLNALVDGAALDTVSFEKLLDQLESLALDLIRWTLLEAVPAEKNTWLNSDAAAALAAHAQALVRRKGGPAGARAWWIERAERIARARQELVSPLNRKLLAQDILLPWLS
jgi:DNA polymerase-3 subunit delta'